MSKSRNDRRENEDGTPDEDRPMNEEQWEAMLRESDNRAARYGELLETFMDHPDGDEIAGGHGMGYDDGAICGNIVCCRKALDGAERSVRGFQALKAGGVVPADLCESLLADVLTARLAIQDRIAELRARVWW